MLRRMRLLHSLPSKRVVNITNEIILTKSLPSICRFESLGFHFEGSQVISEINFRDIHDYVEKSESGTGIRYCLGRLAWRYA